MHEVSVYLSGKTIWRVKWVKRTSYHIRPAQWQRNSNKIKQNAMKARGKKKRKEKRKKNIHKITPRTNIVLSNNQTERTWQQSKHTQSTACFMANAIGYGMLNNVDFMGDCYDLEGIFEIYVSTSTCLLLGVRITNIKNSNWKVVFGSHILTRSLWQIFVNSIWYSFL